MSAPVWLAIAAICLYFALDKLSMGLNLRDHLERSAANFAFAGSLCLFGAAITFAAQVA